jgi:hypothetical protein
MSMLPGIRSGSVPSVADPLRTSAAADAARTSDSPSTISAVTRLSRYGRLPLTNRIPGDDTNNQNKQVF